jgi:hypothetical protein
MGFVSADPTCAVSYASYGAISHGLMNANEHPPRTRAPSGFWLKVLGLVLLLGSVGLVSCQALFVL